MSVPADPKIYHIIHIDRLAGVVNDGFLWSDAEAIRRKIGGTTIGMNQIKERRLNQNHLQSHPEITVGQCVPFYFCPRSVMLYLLHQGNHPDLDYRGGQRPILHLELDFHLAVEWAEANQKRWAFTLSNAGSSYFEDRADLGCLGEIDWTAVAAPRWAGQGVSSTVKEGKQAEFLVEHCFPWDLVERIGIHSAPQSTQIGPILTGSSHRPPVEVKRDWYY